MKVPKSISIDGHFLNWIIENRPKFYAKFSQNIEHLLKKELQTTSENAVDYRKTTIAKKLNAVNLDIEKLKLKHEALLLEMDFYETKSKEVIK